jgi:hypothetical protein
MMLFDVEKRLLLLLNIVMAVALIRDPVVQLIMRSLDREMDQSHCPDRVK